MFKFLSKKVSFEKQTDSLCEHIPAAPNSIFCKKCGAIIRNLPPKTNQSKIKGAFHINNCYICVLHFRRKSAMITPSSYPITTYVVTYNGKCEHNFLGCNDSGESIKIIIDSENITLKFDTHTEKLHYTKNEICTYHVPICDASESWKFIISDAPIQHELFTPNFQKGNDGIYYNLEDMEENKRRLYSISNGWK